MNFFENFKFIDLTHTIDKNIPTWSGECGFYSEILMDYEQGARVLEYTCSAGSGTHMDAPSHFIMNGRHIDQLTLEELCSPICVIDMSEKMHKNAQITLDDFKRYEQIHGKIPSKSVVLGHTGWSRYWNNLEMYRGNKEYPEAPTFSSDVGELLLEREVSGIGIDTFSPDRFGCNFPLHNLLLEANKFIIENLNNLDKLSKKGSYLIALPLKIKEGSESPIRAIGLVPNKS